MDQSSCQFKIHPSSYLYLRAALSLDGGMTFPFKRDIMAGEGSYAYPTALQTPEGRIHVMFTSNDRTTIRLATFEESFLLSGD